MERCDSDLHEHLIAALTADVILPSNSGHESTVILIRTLFDQEGIIFGITQQYVQQPIFPAREQVTGYSLTGSITTSPGGGLGRD